VAGYQLALAVLNTLQVCLLAWIAAWQQRAAYAVRELTRADLLPDGHERTFS
jgi:hypothetical protein